MNMEEKRSIVLTLNNDNRIIIVRMNMEEKRRSIVLTLNNDNCIIIIIVKMNMEEKREVLY